jgi:hypothetical protein
MSITSNRTLKANETDVINRHMPSLLEYKDFCSSLDDTTIHNPDDYTWDEQDFYSLSIGYFIAKGATGNDAFTLATLCRYVLNGFA